MSNTNTGPRAVSTSDSLKDQPVHRPRRFVHRKLQTTNSFRSRANSLIGFSPVISIAPLKTCRCSSRRLFRGDSNSRPQSSEVEVAIELPATAPLGGRTPPPPRATPRRSLRPVRSVTPATPPVDQEARDVTLHRSRAGERGPQGGVGGGEGSALHSRP